VSQVYESLCEPWVNPAKVIEPRRGDTNYQ